MRDTIEREREVGDNVDNSEANFFFSLLHHLYRTQPDFKKTFVL